MPGIGFRKELKFGDVLKLDSDKYRSPEFLATRVIYLGQGTDGHLGIGFMENRWWPTARCEWLFEAAWVKDETWPED